MIDINKIVITPEMLNLIAEMDEFKGMSSSTALLCRWFVRKL